MRNLSDHDIDQLFKDAAGQNQPEFDPADWEIMQHRLVASPWWLEAGKWFGGVVVVGVLVSSLWIASDSQSSDVSDGNVDQRQQMATAEPSTESVGSLFSDSLQDNSVASSDQKIIANESVDRRIRSSRTQSVNRESDGHSASDSSQDNPVASNDQKTIAEDNVGRRIRSSRTPPVSSKSDLARQEMDIAEDAKESRPDEKSVETVTVVSNETSGKRSAKDGAVQTSDEVSGKAKSENGFVSSEEIGTDASERDDIAEGKNLLAAKAMSSEVHSAENKERHKGSDGSSDRSWDQHSDKGSSADSALVDETSLTDKKEIDDENQDSTLTEASFARLAVRLKASPDFSSENFTESGKTGINYGFEVEYFMSQHVFLSAGLIRSRKYYGVHDAAYMDFVGLDIDGDCAMWDIPLNVNYYATPSSQYSFFASAGFSSYLMSEENYQFQVTTPGYQGPETNTYSQQVRNENQEWFKILNVSIGVQRRINKNFALQIEPFIKVPLAEVGSSNVSLSSFGTYLSLRYNLLFR